MVSSKKVRATWRRVSPILALQRSARLSSSIRGIWRGVGRVDTQLDLAVVCLREPGAVTLSLLGGSADGLLYVAECGLLGEMEDWSGME